MNKMKKVQLTTISNRLTKYVLLSEKQPIPKKRPVNKKTRDFRDSGSRKNSIPKPIATRPTFAQKSHF